MCACAVVVLRAVICAQERGTSDVSTRFWVDKPRARALSGPLQTCRSSMHRHINTSSLRQTLSAVILYIILNLLTSIWVSRCMQYPPAGTLSLTQTHTKFSLLTWKPSHGPSSSLADSIKGNLTFDLHIQLHWITQRLEEDALLDRVRVKPKKVGRIRAPQLNTQQRRQKMHGGMAQNCWLLVTLSLKGRYIYKSAAAVMLGSELHAKTVMVRI